MQITLETMRRFAGPKASAEILQAIVDVAPVVLPKYGITTPARMRQFFSNIAVESAGFTTIREENLTYTTTKRLRQVWPSRFPTDAAAAPFVRNPQKLANTVYANRMGNGAPSTGDGFRFRGRSLPQLTGKDAYLAIGAIMGLDLAANPHLICELPHILEAAAAFWKWKGAALVRAADAGQTSAVRKIWNGGTTGLNDVLAWLARADKVFTSPLEAAARPASLLAEPVADELPAEPEADGERDGEIPVEDEQDENLQVALPPVTEKVEATAAEESAATLSAAEIEAVQRRLKALKYHELGMIDGKWGGRLCAAIAAFKNDRHLSGEPVIDDALKAELDAAEAEGWTRPISPERANGVPEGSRVVDAAQKQGTTGLVATVIGIVTGIGSWLSDKFDAVRETIEPLRPLFRPIGHFIVDHWPVVLIAGGAFIAWQSARVWHARVQDHREGKTT